VDIKGSCCEDIQLFKRRTVRVWSLIPFGVRIVLPWIVDKTHFLGFSVYLVNLISIHCIVVIGLSIRVGYTGQISMGHAGFFAIGAFTAPWKSNPSPGKSLSSPMARAPRPGRTSSMYAMAKRKTGPVAMINVEAEPIIAVGVAMGNIPLVDRLDKNPLEVIATGDHVRINGDQGIVEITKR
jgi:ABC-type branched-subunit amino acid transport system permease subunit